MTSVWQPLLCKELIQHLTYDDSIPGKLGNHRSIESIIYEINEDNTNFSTGSMMFY